MSVVLITVDSDVHDDNRNSDGDDGDCHVTIPMQILTTSTT